MEKKIVLEVRKPREAHVCDVVKINRAAREALEALILETGLSARAIASALIVQGAEIAEIVEVQ